MEVTTKSGGFKPMFIELEKPEEITYLLDILEPGASTSLRDYLMDDTERVHAVCMFKNEFYQKIRKEIK